MTHSNYPQLKWQPILLIKLVSIPFSEAISGLSVERMYMAEGADGILKADWAIPDERRYYPFVQLIGWKPLRDVPFKPPIKFQRQGDPRVISLIPSGTWVLPYDEELYQIYESVKLRFRDIANLLKQVDQSPDNLEILTRLANWLE